MTLLDKGFRLRLEALSVQRLCDLAEALDVDPERLPYVERSRSDARLANQLRSAIRSDLRAAAKGHGQSAP